MKIKKVTFIFVESIDNDVYQQCISKQDTSITNQAENIKIYTEARKKEKKITATNKNPNNLFKMLIII